MSKLDRCHTAPHEQSPHHLDPISGMTLFERTRINFYWDNPETMPPEFRANIRYCRLRHPFHQTVVTTAETAGELMNDGFPGIAKRFGDILIPAVQSDVIRYLALYRWGGWYFDTDLRVVGNIGKFPKDRPVLFERNMPDKDLHITNMALYFPKAHPMLEALLVEIEKNFNEERHVNRVVNFTGPHLVTNVLKGFPDVMKDSLYPYNGALRGRRKGIVSGTASPLDDNDKPVRTTWRYQQAFGILRGSKADFTVLPIALPEKQAESLIRFMTKHDFAHHIPEILEHRGNAYLRSELFRAYAEDYQKGAG